MLCFISGFFSPPLHLTLVSSLRPADDYNCMLTGKGIKGDGAVLMFCVIIFNLVAEVFLHQKKIY